MIGDSWELRFFAKAERALAAAEILLQAGDSEGACSRAYYAMFDAAHACLYALGGEDRKAPVKTHNGLIAKFGQVCVLGGHVSPVHGEAFNAVQRLRQLADYSGDLIALDDARWSVGRAEAFLGAVKAVIGLDAHRKSSPP